MVIRGFCCSIDNRCLLSGADLCDHVRQQVRMSTCVRPTLNFGYLVLDDIRLQGLRETESHVVDRSPDDETQMCFWAGFQIPHSCGYIIVHTGFQKRHQHPSSLSHGGLRIYFIVSAARSDAENQLRLAERSPATDAVWCEGAGSAGQAFSAIKTKGGPPLVAYRAAAVSACL
jgi:hypothetical protein